jgi:hypothetical protein
MKPGYAIDSWGQEVSDTLRNQRLVARVESKGIDDDTPRHDRARIPGGRKLDGAERYDRAKNCECRELESTTCGSDSWCSESPGAKLRRAFDRGFA